MLIYYNKITVLINFLTHTHILDLCPTLCVINQRIEPPETNSTLLTLEERERGKKKKENFTCQRAAKRDFPF